MELNIEMNDFKYRKLWNEFYGIFILIEKIDYLN